ncbi:HAMP domain-containing protein [Anaerovirgula multivorans]|uniref:histidine kinase n=1 Tax=Anaerovirgula multivorans TaxID=312168 RepID=A0A239CIE8_9FIRM|nr:HAMP domain-containing sensor histidine kinase [Anaerovirgula multivorans]SNS19471.1 HAMP domain-containing protein [Anaerovirgula multivorans]
MKNKYVKGIRIKFLFIFFISFFLSVFSGLYINNILRNQRTDYSKEISIFNSRSAVIIDDIKRNFHNTDELKRIIDEYRNRIEVFIVDKKGYILLKPKYNYQLQLNIDEVLLIQNAKDFQDNQIVYYIVEAIDNETYVVLSSSLIKQDDTRALFFALIIFIPMFLLLSYGRIKYIDTLSKGIIEVSKGKLDYRVPIKGTDELTVLGENINYMAEELQNLKAKEQENEAAKNRLIVNMSHDLRTPLTSIIGFIKLLKGIYTGKDEIDRYIDIIDDKAHRLEGLIDDLFEYTKLTSYDIKLSIIEVSLNELIRQVIEEMMPISTENNIKIQFDMPQQEILINIDPTIMIRVFENIIINAIRYSEKPGKINIKVLEEKNGVMIAIENKGEAIKKEDLNKVFDRFYRTDEARNSETGGSGIGLSIAKAIINLHNGKIWAECQGKSVVFYVLIR